MNRREIPSDEKTQRRIFAFPTHYDAYQLVVVNGADVGRKAVVDARTSAKVLIGTARLSDLTLSDRSVSRRHAAVELTEHGLFVTDLDSTNGTFINDLSIKVASFRERDALRLGDTTLHVLPCKAEPRDSAPVRSFGRMASSSARMLRVFALCERLAGADMPVIIEGETGTGKELLAESVHEASARAAHPFVVLDCRTTPRDLVEAHLFGEVRPDGTLRPGIFDLIAGGTLLIDEPGDLDLTVQTKLLRALDKKTFTHQGDIQPTPLDARIIVASTQNLDKLVEEGRFREDLYYRLAGARIEMPPLRRRREDIPAIAGELWSAMGGSGELPSEVLERMGDYDWPGNVRELERTIERFLMLGDKISLHFNRAPRSRLEARIKGELGEGAEPNHEDGNFIKKILIADLAYSEARRLVLEEFERAYLEKALATSGGNVAAAAARSGIGRRYFHRIRARQK